ncbi:MULTISPECIES: TerC family protein [Bacillus]|nr:MULTISPECIES: TerC family protein [Bacillus]MCY7767556.1 TerC family protein [Bacillus inaquosorum]MCY9078282.1 TerC family protein [Bacillus inaquosorum]MCY9099009.1 TerC family protein [Bacillus inaquosorum]MCY9309781.1 TerC family protein [Bacillus inaquosorum]
MLSGNKVVISWIVISIGFVGMPEFMSSKTFALCRQRSFLYGPAGIRSDEEKENNFFGRVSFMDAALLLEYGWVLLVLIGLEGILAADNALVMAVMVKHLPEEKRKKALFYGLAGAFVLRFGSLFAISFLVNVWQVQAIGAIYLLYISASHLLKRYVFKKEDTHKETKQSGFWPTVLKVELADIAFAVDSILAAVALAVTLPGTSLPKIGGLDGGQFIVILAGGIIGLVIMRFAASMFVKLLKERPSLETAAFVIVGWVGVKLALYTLAHQDIAVVSEHFIHSGTWKLIFWGVLAAIAVCGWFMSGAKKQPEGAQNEQKNSSRERA